MESIPKVKGSMTASAVNAESPGSAPTIRPPKVPTIIRSIVCGFAMVANPPSNSMVLSFPQKNLI